MVRFHVTANAEWSSLPLSGLFVEMMERLAVSSAYPETAAEDLEGTTWTPNNVMDGFGTLEDAGALPSVPGPELLTGAPGPDLRPGIYQSGDRLMARNVVGMSTALTPIAWPDRIPVSGLTVAEEMPLGGFFLGLAIALLLIDIIASLALSTRLTYCGLVFDPDTAQCTADAGSGRLRGHGSGRGGSGTCAYRQSRRRRHSASRAYWPVRHIVFPHIGRTRDANRGGP